MRECGCPEWIERCVHREGVEEVLVMAKADALYELHPPHPRDWREGGYTHAVYLVSSEVNLPCNCGCGTSYAAGINEGRIKARYRSATEAVAAFLLAEEALSQAGA